MKQIDAGLSRTLAVTSLRRKLSSVSELVQDLKTFRKEGQTHKNTMWFRGLHDKTFKLIPSAGRPLRFNGRMLCLRPQDEYELLHRFRRRAYPALGRLIGTWEALLMARHHRLPTRLLDWSRSPLSALWFACHEAQDSPGAVWGIVRSDEVSQSDTLDLLRLAANDAPGEGPFDYFPRLLRNRSQHPDPTEYRYVDAVKLIHPFYNTPRIAAQDGAFTVHFNPRRALESYAGTHFACDRLDISTLVRWSIPAAAKKTIIADLDLLGVNHRTLFPDLDGLAISLWETEVLYRGHSPVDAPDKPRNPSNDTCTCPADDPSNDWPS